MQQLCRRFVDQADRVVLIDDQDALAQMLHDELIELRQIRDVDFALSNEFFALSQAAASGPTPSVTMNISAPTMPAAAKSLVSPRPASDVMTC